MLLLFAISRRAFRRKDIPMPLKRLRTRSYNLPFFGIANNRFPSGMLVVKPFEDEARGRLAAVSAGSSVAGRLVDIWEVLVVVVRAREKNKCI